MEVGIRQLRADLSRWVKRARDGEEIVVTDRGVPVARIVPVSGQRPFDILVAAGVITPATDRSGWAPGPEERIRAKGTVSDLVAEQRR